MLGCGYSNTIALPVLAAAALSTSYTCSAPHIKFLKLTTQQRRVHCWGGAERNPRIIDQKNYGAREAADRGRGYENILRLPFGCRPLRGLRIFLTGMSWGSARKASLHPRLYADARYRGLAGISPPNDFLCKAPRIIDVRVEDTIALLRPR